MLAISFDHCDLCMDSDLIKWKYLYPHDLMDIAAIASCSYCQKYIILATYTVTVLHKTIRVTWQRLLRHKT